MPDHGDMSERHGRVLAELAEAGMAMVRRLSDAMQRTDDVQTLAQLGLAFHRVSRGVRQTMALEFRLADAPRKDRRASVPAREAPRAEPATPRAPAERTGWNEYESDDDDEALDELDTLLEAEDFDLEAVHEAVETCIARIRHDLGADPALVVEPSEAAAASAPSFAGPRLAGPGQAGRRSGLMSATALARPLGAVNSS